MSVVAHTFLIIYFDFEFPTDPPQLPSEKLNIRILESCSCLFTRLSYLFLYNKTTMIRTLI